MPDTITTNYGWVQPQVGGSFSTWGNKLNDDLAKIDGVMFGMLPQTGGTISGSLGVSGNFSVNGTTWLNGNVDLPNGMSILYDTADNFNTFNFGQGSWIYRNNANGSLNIGAGGQTTAFDGGGISISGGLWMGGSASITGNLQVQGSVWAYNGAVTGSSVVSTGTLQAGAQTYFATSSCGYGFGAWSDGSSQNRYIQFSPQWYVGWSAPQGGLLFWSTPAGFVVQIDGQGDMTLPIGWGKSAYGWTTLSDERIKRNIADYTPGLTEVNRIRPISYQHNGAGGTRDDGRVRYGVSAQAARAVLPGMVQEMPDREGFLPGQLSLDYTPLTLALVNAVKELSARVQALEARLAEA